MPVNPICTKNKTLLKWVQHHQWWYLDLWKTSVGQVVWSSPLRLECQWFVCLHTSSTALCSPAPVTTISLTALIGTEHKLPPGTSLAIWALNLPCKHRHTGRLPHPAGTPAHPSPTPHPLPGSGHHGLSSNIGNKTISTRHRKHWLPHTEVKFLTYGRNNSKFPSKTCFI